MESVVFTSDSCGAQLVKHLPAMQETWVQFLARDICLENVMATHSSILVWRIHGQKSLDGLQYMGLYESDMT